MPKPPEQSEEVLRILRAAGDVKGGVNRSAAQPDSEYRESTGKEKHSSVFDKLTPYPKPLGPAAYYGIAGQFVRLVEPHTEADPNFLLIAFLIHAGNVLGRDAWVWAGGDKHHTNLFGCAVGPTSTGRKGSAASPIRMFFESIDDDWVRAITSGLSTGEGLINAVRDPVFRREKASKGRGAPVSLEEVCTDEGVSDKRVLVIQSEFYGALAAMKRQGNTLSATMRDAWDKGDLRTMVKNSPARATGAHISNIANINRDELLRGMLVDDFDNGFSNRFLWICSQRSKELPEGGALWMVDFGPLQRDFIRVRGIVKGAVTRNVDASDDWGYDDTPGGAYRYLTRERGGMYGAVTARAAAQVLRLSLIYALLDGSDKIRREHLEAALEVWRYCEESAAFIFGDATGDPTADAIITALRTAGAAGMTRTEMTNFFKRNKSSEELSRALLVLHRGGQARFEREETAGRTIERWFAIRVADCK